MCTHSPVLLNPILLITYLFFQWFFICICLLLWGVCMCVWIKAGIKWVMLTFISLSCPNMHAYNINCTVLGYFSHLKIYGYILNIEQIVPGLPERLDSRYEERVTWSVILSHWKKRVAFGIIACSASFFPDLRGETIARWFASISVTSKC